MASANEPAESDVPPITPPPAPTSPKKHGPALEPFLMVGPSDAAPPIGELPDIRNWMFPPEDLQRYEALEPGFTRQLLRVLDQELEHRRVLEREAREAEALRLARFGRTRTDALAALAILGGCAAATLALTTAGGLAGGLVAIGGVLLGLRSHTMPLARRLLAEPRASDRRTITIVPARSEEAPAEARD